MRLEAGPVEELTQPNWTLRLQQIAHQVGRLLAQGRAAGIAGAVVVLVVMSVGIGVVVVVDVVAVVRWRADIKFGFSARDTQATGLPCIVQGSDAGQACEHMDVVVGG